MDLFVINRHYENNEEKTQDDEQLKLDRVLNKIELNKRYRQSHRQAQKEKKRLHKLEIEEKKAQIVSVPTNEEFIDEHFKEPELKNDEAPKNIQSVSVPPQEFTILGNDQFEKKTKVKRVLPKWLANPTIISVNLKNLQVKVKDIKQLDKSLYNTLKANGIKYFFPVQAEVIPWLLETNVQSNILYPRDVCVSAPTGSGKTLAFVLPVVQSLMNNTIKKIRALIILPTQDLANQVYKTFKMYTQHTNLNVALITGKTSFANEQKQLVIENEAFGYLSKVDILVCTAGRLVDHLKSTKGFSLQNLEYLVIDEADRVLETVQNDWLYHLEKHIYQDESPASRMLNLSTLKKHRPPQKLLFSATLSQDPEKLQKLSLFQPKLFTSVVEKRNSEVTNDVKNQESFVGKYTTPNELTEKFITCNMELKPLVLYEFIKRENLTKSIVFTHSIESTHRLAILLQSLFGELKKVKEISSTLDPKARNNLITEFETGNIDVLVCTDTLARGIDLPCVQCVISYSAPKYIKTYIHRVGRTARAGVMGLAVTLINKSQLIKFNHMLHQAGKADLEEIIIHEDELETLTYQYKEALTKLKSEVQKEDDKEIQKIKASKRLLPDEQKKKFKRKRKNSVNVNN